MNRLTGGLVLAAAMIALDQITKWWILLSVMQPPQVIELTPFFNLVLTWNRGVSFGMFDTNATAAPYILSAVAVLVVIALVVWLSRGPGRFVAGGLGLIIGGAVGNVILHGAVVDFLDVHVAGYHWPAFNVADSCITVGAAVLILDSLFAGRTRKVNIRESQ
jgi:signal peptidase II